MTKGQLTTPATLIYTERVTHSKTPRRWHSIAWLIALSVVLNGTAIWWGLPNSASWAPDEISPSRVLDGLSHLFSGGWTDKYPPVHFYALAVVLLPFLGLDRLKAVDFSRPQAAAVIVIAFRLLTLLMAAGLIYLVYACGRELYDRRGALFAAMITMLLVPFLYYAKTANLEVPYLFWFVWSLYFFIRLSKTGRRRYYLLFAMAAVLCAGTKDQAAGLFVLAPLIILWNDWKKRTTSGPDRMGRGSRLAKTYLAMIAVAIGTFLLGYNVPLNFKGFLGHIKLITGPASEPYQMVPRTAAGYGHLLVLILGQIRFCLGWPLLLICLAGLLLVLSRKPRNRELLFLLAFGFSYLVFFLGLVRFSYDRFVLPLAIILAFFGGPALSELLGGRPKILRAAVVIAVFAFSFLSALSVDVLMIRDSRYTVEKWLRANIKPSQTLGTATPIEYLPRIDGYNRVSLSLRPAEFMRAPKPDYIIFTTEYARNYDADSPENPFFSWFWREPPGYLPAFRYRTSLPWRPVRFENVYTNLQVINLEIQVYARRDRAQK
jgi:hypothetical protein